MRRSLFLTLVLVAGLLASAGPAFAGRDDNWHWHDGIEAGVVFFPEILGQTVAEYLLDPAYCTDATDKALLGPTGINANQVLNAGHCQTSTTIIHIWRNPGLPTPNGWTAITFGGSAFYHLLTAR